MKNSTTLLKNLAPKHLLRHPFYRDWSDGKLSVEDLRKYAMQYFHHVDAFPRYISATHSNCSKIKARQVLLENLRDEENGEENHPELWLRFAEALGAKREAVKSAALYPETQELIDTFFKAGRSSYPEGLGALFAYENQVPEVAASKIEGLEKFYGIKNREALQFFTVHLKADIYHTQACAELIDELEGTDRKLAMDAAENAGDALWKFLDGVQRETCSAA